MRVLGFGTYDTSRHPRVGVIFEGLRAHGDAVVEINLPLGFPTAERVAMLRSPWRAGRFVARLFTAWVSISRRAVVARRTASFDAVVVGYLGTFDVLLARALFPRTPLVYDQLIFAADTARDRGVSNTLTLKMLEVIDKLAASAADVILIDTDESVELLPAEYRPKAVVVPVGASRSWFEAGAARPGSDSARPLRLVFFGLFTPLQGAPVIARALALLSERADIEATMVGTGQDYDTARALAAPNQQLTWLDWVDAMELPGLVARHDVCLGVFGTSPKAGRVVPNKVYQGAAAGCAVVTSDTLAQRRALGDDALFVHAGDALALAGVLRELAEDRPWLEQLRLSARRRSGNQFTAAEVVSGLRDRLLTSTSARAQTGGLR